MIEMQVRYRCQPEKLLGYIKLPYHVQAGTTVNFSYLPNAMYMRRRPATDSMKVVTLPVEVVRIGCISILAIQAEGMGLDELRRIAGFRSAIPGHDHERS